MESIISVWVKIPKRPGAGVYSISKYIADKYRVYGLLRDQKGPHITIFSQRVKNSALPEIITRLKRLLKHTPQFAVNIRNYGHFTEPNEVIYLKVAKTKSMSGVYRLLKGEFGNNQIGYPRFNPHITLAHDKLYKVIGGKILRPTFKEFKGLKFSKTFTAKDLYISSHPKTDDKRHTNLKIIRVRLKG